jgi:hypothetical protein
VLVAGLVVAAAAGGGAALATAGPPQPQSGHPTPPTEVLDAYAAEQRLIAAIDASVQADPALRGDLAPIRADHAAHAAALGRGALGAAELQASAAAVRRAAALAGPVATLLASIAASEAAHQQVLA